MSDRKVRFLLVSTLSLYSPFTIKTPSPTYRYNLPNFGLLYRTEATALYQIRIITIHDRI